MKHILSVLFAVVGLICTTGVALADIVPAETPSENVAAIQAEIDAAAIQAEPGTVTLGEGLFEIDAQLMVTGGVTLVGQGWDKTILKQTMARVVNTNTLSLATRVVWIDNGATVSHLAITGGSVNREGGWSFGGGACVKNGTISWCCITNNTSGADVSPNNFGGGVSFDAGMGRIDHSIVAGNVVRGLQSSFGGGIAIRHPIGNVTIDTCLISGNHVFNKQNGGGTPAYGGGAGVVVENVYSSEGYNMTVRNSTIVGNSAEGAADWSLGGAVLTMNDNGNKFSMLNCIIADNTTAGTNTTVELSYAGGVDYCLFNIEADKVGDNSLFGDPIFVGVEDDDYRLELDSHAVGAGTTYEGIGNDLNNAAFSDPPSMGCYEYAELAARPVFEIASGTVFYTATNVTLSCATEGATIYYTTDGSRPTDASTLFTGPIAISATTTIRARAYALNVGPSGISTATYTLKRPTPPFTDFKKYVEVTLSTDLASSEITTGVPALVKLSESTIAGFDYDDFSLANGGDMMFVDENGNPVPHEIDTWNTNTDGESLVWVKLPSTAENTKIFMYYGNGAISSEEAADVWTDYVGVWHFEEATAATVANSYGTYANSTAITGIDGNVAEYTITDEAGRFGKSFRVNNSDGMKKGNYQSGGVWVNDSGSNSPIDGGQNFTISGWFKHDGFGYCYDHMFYKRRKSNNSDSPNNAFAIESNSNGGTNPQVYARGSSGDGGRVVNEIDGMIITWAYLTFVYDGTTCRAYENGVPKDSATIAACIDNDSPLAFGNNCDISWTNVADNAWNGWIDEVRYSKGSKSAEWIAAEFAAMNTSETDIFTYGAAQEVGIKPGATASETRQTIQDAIDAAAPTHGTVTLASGLFEINAQLNVTSGVTLVGQGWENTVIKQVTQVTYGANSRCAMLDDGAKLNGITLTGGTIKNENDGGAGVWVKNGTASWCCITNNVGGQHNVYGCGVSFSGGQGTIDHCIISDNRADSGFVNYYGGGIGGLNTVGPVIIDTCLIANNTLGSESAGGGIGIKGENLDCVIRNCTVVGNTASLHAGGIRLEMTDSNHGSAVILNTIAVGNKLGGNESNYAVNTDTIGITGSGNCFFGLESEANSIPDSLFGDPLFFDAANGDYRLRENSGAAKAGVSYPGIGVDLANLSFAATPSIGCYEYDPNAQPPAGEWDIPGGGSGSGGIKGLDDGHGGKCVAFTAIERVGSDVAVEFQAAEIGASVGASFGLICKDNLADTETFTLNAQLTAVDTTNVLGTLKTKTDKTQLFVVGIGPAQ